MTRVQITIGPLHVQVGGMRVRRMNLSWPDGLHIWWGDRGVHCYWSRSPYQVRFITDRIEGRK